MMGQLVARNVGVPVSSRHKKRAEKRESETVDEAVRTLTTLTTRM
jgi:hypothetical protein